MIAHIGIRFCFGKEAASDTEQTIEAEIPVLWSPGTEIYVKATDAANPAAYSFFPERGPDEPILVEVFPESLSLPYTQDFEGGDLLSLNWWSPCEGRDTFTLFRNTSNGNGEGASAYHPAGSSGIDEVRDWLISPPLDFSGGRWCDGWLVGRCALGSEDSSHSLWVSTDQRLPDAGTYVEVQTLDVPLNPAGEDIAMLISVIGLESPWCTWAGSGQERSLMNGISTT